MPLVERIVKVDLIEVKGEIIETTESIQKEISFMEIQTKRDEVKGLRDKPNILKQREENVTGRENEVQGREDEVEGKEIRLNEREDDLTNLEISIGLQTRKVKNQMEKGIEAIGYMKKQAEGAVTTLNRYIDRAKLSHYCDLEQKLSEDDVAKLADTLNAIKQWRNW